jgi:transposase-like protein
MVEYVKVGDFCANESCPDYKKLKGEQKGSNIQKNGKTKAGRQRYRCKTCGKTFTETKGTIFYRKRTEEAEILETLALIAEGSRISSLARVKGHKEDTILAWLREAAEHAEEVEEYLMANYRLERGQLDALWLYVGNKGEKKLSRNG